MGRNKVMRTFKWYKEREQAGVRFYLEQLEKQKKFDELVKKGVIHGQSQAFTGLSQKPSAH